MDKTKIRTMRLKKEEISLDKQPMENAFVRRQQNLNFYYCLYNLEDDFKHGFYFGLLQLHPEYPFAAPKLFMYTPNGRYEVDMAICTSFTNYHQQTWTSAWNVRSLIQATISFMYANEPSYGCRSDSSAMRKKYARDSLSWNMENQLFKRLFGETITSKLPELIKMGIHIYDKNLILQVKKLGLAQDNQSNTTQMKERNQLQNFIHQLEPDEGRDRLIEPLVVADNIDHVIEIEPAVNRLYLIDEQLIRQRQKALRQQQRKKQQKVKKIMRILGYIAVVAAFGAVIYYVWIKPGPQVATQQYNDDSNVKSKGISENIKIFASNVTEFFKGWRRNNSEKVIEKNS